MGQVGSQCRISSMASFKSLEHSLSIMYTLGLLPLDFNILCIFIMASLVVASCLFLLVWVVSYFYHSHTQPLHISFHGLICAGRLLEGH